MITLDRYGLSFVLCAAVGAALLLTGCEEALTDSNNEGLPNIDGTGEPWVEFTGADTTGLEERGGTVDFTVAPGHTPADTLEVFFSVTGNGTAQQGRDFVVQTSSPITIPIDPTNNNLEEKDITVQFPHSDQVNEVKTMELQLDRAQTLSGESVPVGRGGTDDNDAKFVSIDWSKASLFIQGSAGFAFDDTEVGSTSETATGPFDPNTGLAGLLGTNDLIVINTADFRTTTLSNFSIEGENAGAFSLTQYYDPLIPGARPGAPPVTLDPAGLLTIAYVVEFSPQSTGEKTASLTFDATNVPASQQSQTIPLQGTAVSSN